MIMYNYNVM